LEAKKFKVSNCDSVHTADLTFPRFVSLLYNAEAVDVENHNRNNQGVASDNASLFLQPVMYDAEASSYPYSTCCPIIARRLLVHKSDLHVGQTIHKLAMYFGRLECFDPYDISDKVDGM
jgi:hypothetical protein